MDTAMKIASALLIVMMLVYLYPRAKAAMQHTPKAGAGDWRAAIIPLLLVVLFVIFLIKSV